MLRIVLASHFVLLSLTLAAAGCKTGDANQKSLVREEVVATLSERLICGMTNTRATPYLTFIIKMTGGRASVSYISNAFFGSEELAREVSYDAMQNMEIYQEGPELSLDGAGDGDGGYVRLIRSTTGTGWSGTFTFPEGGPAGIREDTRISVGCREEGGASGGDTGGDSGAGVGSQLSKLVCSATNTSARPYFTFIVYFRGERASVSYVRSAFFGSEEVQREVQYEAMQDMEVNRERAGRIWMDGDGDGDGGFVRLTESQGAWSGMFTFPEGGPGGIPEDSTFRVNCRSESGAERNH